MLVTMQLMDELVIWMQFQLEEAVDEVLKSVETKYIPSPFDIHTQRR